MKNHVVILLSAAAVAVFAACGAPTTQAGTSHPPLKSSDVAGAEQSALAMFTKHPLNLSDPSAGYVWTGGASSASHLSPKVNARLAELSASGFFSDAGGCGEDYISGTQNGLFTAPTIISTQTSANDRVTVVIQRGQNIPNLTAVMGHESGVWLADDLASGVGPSSSIFSEKPNC